MATATSSAIITGKRKRNVVNYAELNSMDIDDEVADVNAVASDEDEDDDGLPENDSVYGSRKKSHMPNKKRAKFTKPAAKKSTKPFPFLSLPAELRDYIYEFALVEPEGLKLSAKTKSHRRTIARDTAGYWKYRRGRKHWISSDGENTTQHTPLVPNLLAVNKQIHDEAVGYLYKQQIILEDTMALHAFIAAIGPTNRLQLEDLVVRGWGCGRGTHKAMNFASLTLLASCTNLKSLFFDCNIGWSRTAKQTARQLHRDGHYFLEAYAAAKGKDAAVEVVKLVPQGEEFEREFREETGRLLGA
ncbi:uncharacterized protein LTR77_004881 [Saxophila tyrrhenica]|uniref:2EXR domain-containing protein n=1 Tax=Saxophila tyrrhenica TaxID=1690608 RepID=A0AAV9PAA5_9PEZI|nr:hypothetical protein LTR77_004881 [Saxophila tyrrhenica]